MRTRSFAVALTVLGASALPAFATEHLLAGTMLSSRNRSGHAKFVWVSKDPAVTLPASPPSVVGATLVVSASDGDTATIALGSGAWSEATGSAMYSACGCPVSACS